MEWINVKDKLPPEEENVILFDGSIVFAGNFHVVHNEPYWGNQGCDGICYGWYEKDAVTHWMPLPKPPEE